MHSSRWLIQCRQRIGELSRKSHLPYANDPKVRLSKLTREIRSFLVWYGITIFRVTDLIVQYGHLDLYRPWSGLLKSSGGEWRDRLYTLLAPLTIAWIEMASN